MVIIRRAGPDDWELVRDIRLRALGDAPSAFGSRLEDERDRTEREWRERLDVADGSTFVAMADDAGVGLVRVSLDEDDPSRAELFSMWVEPEHRGAGVADALVGTVFDWARARRVRAVGLWVTETNDPARRLYERHGFEPTPRRQPHPSYPNLSEVAMEARVGA